ncbi:hypothetical protein J2128_000702 [Methanomicrobium sp. W14]|uniref:hypothetical protein n=1 Tax=Methanomicrobium sp. W14 TaxID=2817839 RepID=UPI001AE1D826|nr:hypothetical protein [Methanomicrobium sp. W14]MBP2132781.1 hypothetical protein [Methanomicrobium sp. W14]
MKGSYLMLFLIFLLFIAVPVSAAGISLETEHTDYYFETGDEAYVPVFTDNSLGHNVSGILSYTTSETTRSQGFSYSSSSSDSQNIVIPKGNSSFTISAGTSDSQKTIEVTLSFKYTESDSYVASLNPIYIHFVSDNGQNGSSGSGNSQTSTESKASSSSSNSGTSSQMQQIIQSMMSQGSSDSGYSSSLYPSQGQSSKQALQNNQMSQDTSALKKQMEEKSAEKNRQKSSLAAIIENNTLYMSVNQSLTGQGFTPGELSVSPSSEDTGSFGKLYSTGSDSGNVSVDGYVDSGNVSYILQTTNMSTTLPDSLTENETYKKFAGLLEKGNYSSFGTQINATYNGSYLQVWYSDEKGKGAYLNATFFPNSSLESFGYTISKDENSVPGLLLLLVIVVSGIIIIYAVYRKYLKKYLIKKPDAIKEPFVPPRIIDPYKEAMSLLEKAVSLFEKEEYIQAYSRTGQALRLYLTYKYGDKTEKTNEEIIKVLPSGHVNKNEIREILLKCSDVEFAKGKPDETAFYEIIDEIKRIISE